MLIDVILKRYSVRSYADKEVPEEILKEVLEAGRLAPSADNYQPWKFVVVRDEKTRDLLMKASMNQSFVAQAPVVIVGCIIRRGYPMGNWYDSAILDIGLALDHMTLQAVHLCLGTCWIGAFSEKEVKRILNIPKDVRVAALLTLGYPKHKSIPSKSRKPLEEMVSFERFE
ncbi:MAG: nitroreductase [Thermotoga sp.]|nr:nitroreductase family protein [Thermotogota bacterium]RKX56199.1 MAG: nitroreductase [Thermotoga sp.]